MAVPINVRKFVDANYRQALKVSALSGIPATWILSSAALESGWGRYSISNNFFGIKDTDGVNGNESRVRTFEDYKDFGKRLSMGLQGTDLGGGFFRYVVDAYFRKYDVPEDSFGAFAALIISRYPQAMQATKGGTFAQWTVGLVAGGYATAVNYSMALTGVHHLVESAVAEIRAEKRLSVRAMEINPFQSLPTT